MAWAVLCAPCGCWGGGGGGLRPCPAGPSSPGSVLSFRSREAGPSVLPQFRQLRQDRDAVQPGQRLLSEERVRQSPQVSAPGEAGLEWSSPLGEQPETLGYRVCGFVGVTLSNIGMFVCLAVGVFLQGKQVASLANEPKYPKDGFFLMVSSTET